MLSELSKEARSYLQFMSARKYITLVILGIFLHQPITFFSISFFGKIYAVRIGLSGSVWAEDNAGPQTVPENQEPSEEQAPQEPNDETTRPNQDTTSTPEIYGPQRGYVDTVQGKISQRVLASAEWLDSFFEDKREIRESNRSYLRLRYGLFMEESTKTKIEMPSLNLQLRLPRLERLGKNINLVFESAPEAEPAGVPVQESNTGAQVLPAESRTTSAALHFLLQKTAKQSFIVRTGALLNLDQTLFFISPRYRLFIPLNSWNFRFTQDIIYRTGTPWQPKTEWETDTLLDLERKLPYDLFFRSYLEGIWLKNTDDYIYNLGFTLLEPLDSKRALSYGWNNRFLTEPYFNLDEILLSIQYRQNFWRKWLFYKVAPQYRFPRDRDFTGTPGILLSLEMYFGYVGSK